jgi:hypothetical protein
VHCIDYTGLKIKLMKKDNSVWICTPKGALVKAFYSFQEAFIKSYTRGGVVELRKWGWDIEKRYKKS